jgi:hypothetical protein
MWTLRKVSAIPVPTLFLSTATVAQTGESAAAIPGEVSFTEAMRSKMSGKDCETQRRACRRRSAEIKAVSYGVAGSHNASQ